MKLKDFKFKFSFGVPQLAFGVPITGSFTNATVYGTCGTSYNCSGGGGECSTSFNCGGGGGQCGISFDCSGGGGQCGVSFDCSGS